MKRWFERNPYRELPDGTVTKVYPFHISLEGLENRVLCREDSDYDAFVKILCVCCRRKNVILIIYAVVSNHSHLVVLAPGQGEADACAEEIKRMFSMYYSRKYSDTCTMQGVDAMAIWLDNDNYLRNAIAYVVRNAMDNGATCIQEYKWTGFRGMFCGGRIPKEKHATRLAGLSVRDRRKIMHTGDNLSNVAWVINADKEIEPASVCDWQYVESAFKDDQSFFLRLVGGVNSSEMTQRLIDSPRIKRPDADFVRSVNELSQRWFQKDIHDLTDDKKARLVHIVSHSFRTDPSQLARAFELSRETVLRWLK